MCALTQSNLNKVFPGLQRTKRPPVFAWVTNAEFKARVEAVLEPEHLQEQEQEIMIDPE